MFLCIVYFTCLKHTSTGSTRMAGFNLLRLFRWQSNALRSSRGWPGICKWNAGDLPVVRFSYRDLPGWQCHAWWCQRLLPLSGSSSAGPSASSPINVLVTSGVSCPANTRNWPSAVLMLARRLRRRPNIKTTLRQCLVLAGGLSPVLLCKARRQ